QGGADGRRRRARNDPGARRREDRRPRRGGGGRLMSEPLGLRTLLVNPPLVGGIAFTRQGRCQEREEVLGTTKPPYTLALAASLLRERGGGDLRLVDLTATGRSIDDLIAQLDVER